MFPMRSTSSFSPLVQVARAWHISQWKPTWIAMPCNLFSLRLLEFQQTAELHCLRHVAITDRCCRDIDYQKECMACTGDDVHTAR